MKGTFKYILFLFVLLSLNELSAQGRLIMEMVVTDEGKKMAGAEIKVFKNGSLVETVLTDAKGRADIPMSLNSTYSIEVGGNKGMIKKKLSVNTSNVDPEAAKGDIFYPAEVEIFKKVEGLDLSILDKPIGKIFYDTEYGDFGADPEYTKTVQKQLAKLKDDFLAQKENEAANAKEMKKKYDAAIKIADKAFSDENWELAAEQYKVAEKLDPLETYPSFQLAELKTKLIAIEKDNKRYDEAIGKADAALASKNYELAIAEYKRASGYKPKEAYPQDKIKETQGLLANAAKVEQNYLAAIEKGDNALKINDMKTAKAAFQEAAELKPDETYPKNKIAEIDDILAKAGAKEKEYNDAVKAGDDALAAKDFALAKSSYEKAKTIKPKEAYPPAQITKVEGLMAAEAKKEQDYLAAIEKGDKALQANQYQEAKTAFELASSIKAEEEYPKNKIKEINDFIAKNEAAEKQYQDKIAEADKALAAKEYAKAKTTYEEAKKLKPTEVYPQQKISEIDLALADLAKKEEQYNAAIEKGDKALVAKDFEAAKTAFNEALSLKADEKYPKDKLAEIETIELKNAASEEAYQTAIQNGADAMENNDFENAKKFYNEAITLKPAEALPKDKLKEIDAIIAKRAEEDKNYNDAVAAGDKAMEAKNFEQAKEDYLKALNFKPEETYPQNQLTKIDTELEKAAKLEADYKAAIAEGDAALAAKEYEKSKAAYQKALEIKASEEYPKSKITEIDQLLAELKGKEEQYNKAIEKADAAFDAEKWEEAKTAYQEAISIKEDDYPKGKIADIDAKIAAEKEALAKVEADYSAAIAEGDAALAAKEYEKSKAAYQKALEIKAGEEYPKTKISEVDQLLAELKGKEEQYNKAIQKADAAFNAEKWEEAKTAYQEAISIKEDDYPKGKIIEIETKLAELQAAQEQAEKLEVDYQAAISEGDLNSATNKYQEAIIAYQKAADLKPNESYPKDKIEEMTAALEKIAQEKAEAEKLAEIEKKYTDLITKADESFSKKEYDLARTDYQAALAIKIEEAYPKTKIEEINGILSDAAEQEQKYNEAITAADGLLAEEKYEEAKAKYNEALGIKSEEAYPKSKISEIDLKLKELADQQAAIELKQQQNAELEAQFQTLITEGDGFVPQRKWDEAIAKYQAALELKDDQGVKDKIAEVEASKAEELAEQARELEELKQKDIDNRYEYLIGKGEEQIGVELYDDAIASFKEALTLKDEQLPKDKLAEIDRLIAAKQSEEEAAAAAEAQAKIDAAYQALITEADALLSSEDYENAKSKYNEALAVKEEQYPKDKIDEIEQAIAAKNNAEEAAAAAEAQAKIDAEYQAVLAEADALLSSEEYENAKSKYKEALAVKDEQYPKDKISEIDQAIAAKNSAEAAAAEAAAQAKIDAEYKALLTEADALFDAGEYNDAKLKYQSAIALKDDAYPKTKITEIDDILSELANQKAEEIKLAKLETDYLAAIEKGDQALASNDYPTALSAFNKALGFKPTENYPKDKIAEINSILDKAAADKEAAAQVTEEKYNSAIAEGNSLLESKEYTKAIYSFEKAEKLKPEESLPKDRIQEIKTILAEIEANKEAIRLKAEQEKNIEVSYQNAIDAGDAAFDENNLEEAENQYRIAAGLKASKPYPQEQLAKIEAIYNERRAAELAAENEKKAALDAERNYKELISKGDAAFDSKSYKNAKRNYEQALAIKSTEQYPKDQLAKLKTLLEQERLKEEERKKNLDKPIQIQTGPKATIDGDAEAEIDKMYAELWAKKNGDKNAKIEGQKEVIKKYNEASLQKELNRRKNAIQLIEDISISIQEQKKMAPDNNLQNYEIVKEQEENQFKTYRELEREAERKRNNASIDKQSFYEKLQEYQVRRNLEIVELNTEKSKQTESIWQENMTAYKKISSDNLEKEKIRIEKEAAALKEKRENDYEGAGERRDARLQDANNLEKEIREFTSSNSESFKSNQLEIEIKTNSIEEAQKESDAEAAKRRAVRLQGANDLENEIKEFTSANSESFKNNQLEVEEKQKKVDEKSDELVAESEVRRQKNKDPEFYTGEKKVRQDQEAADYPQGFTEEIIENQNNSTTIRRIVVEGTQTDIYEKTLYSWGGVFYTKNGNNITKDTWDKESKQ